MAARMVERLEGGGHPLGDAPCDASWLFDWRDHHGHQRVCPRGEPGTGLGRRYVSPHRRRAVETLESPARVNPFGPDLHALRTDVERDFPGLACFGGGPTTLPSGVRRIRRVRAGVTAKPLINAVRIRMNRKAS
jgi:hypothetical protein